MEGLESLRPRSVYGALRTCSLRKARARKRNIGKRLAFSATFQIAALRPSHPRPSRLEFQSPEVISTSLPGDATANTLAGYTPDQPCETKRVEEQECLQPTDERLLIDFNNNNDNNNVNFVVIPTVREVEGILGAVSNHNKDTTTFHGDKVPGLPFPVFTAAKGSAYNSSHLSNTSKSRCFGTTSVLRGLPPPTLLGTTSSRRTNGASGIKSCLDDEQHLYDTPGDRRPSSCGVIAQECPGSEESETKTEATSYKCNVNMEGLGGLAKGAQGVRNMANNVATLEGLVSSSLVNVNQTVIEEIEVKTKDPSDGWKELPKFIQLKKLAKAISTSDLKTSEPSTNSVPPLTHSIALNNYSRIESMPFHTCGIVSEKTKDLLCTSADVLCHPSVTPHFVMDHTMNAEQDMFSEGATPLAIATGLQHHMLLPRKESSSLGLHYGELLAPCPQSFSSTTQTSIRGHVSLLDMCVTDRGMGVSRETSDLFPYDGSLLSSADALGAGVSFINGMHPALAISKCGPLPWVPNPYHTVGGGIGAPRCFLSGAANPMLLSASSLLSVSGEGNNLTANASHSRGLMHQTVNQTARSFSNQEQINYRPRPSTSAAAAASKSVKHSSQNWVLDLNLASRASNLDEFRLPISPFQDPKRGGGRPSLGSELIPVPPDASWNEQWSTATLNLSPTNRSVSYPCAPYPSQQAVSSGPKLSRPRAQRALPALDLLAKVYQRDFV